jgi:hypothetical protein
MPVKAEIALANLQPVPGAVEYVSGSPACYYKKITIHSTKDGKDRDQWFRCNLMITEDLGQVICLHSCFEKLTCNSSMTALCRK